MASSTVCSSGKEAPSAVAVYCGASTVKKSIFPEKAAGLGRCLAGRGIKVVFGGSAFGLLGTLADAVLEGGGQLTGIIPEFFTRYDGYTAPGEEIIVPDMHTRKKLMYDSVEAFIALPGGVGTMEELTEMLTWYKLDLHQKPIGLLNVDSYYDHFIGWLSRAIEEGFITHEGSVDSLLVISEDPADLVEKLCSKWRDSRKLSEKQS
ncbi:cytokinin riboside 5'-monophosphate phosphoribohydrolase-like [Halichondria panicea]|uniref:cytokinin riboside 5'-monophosphate phosphoribohydrolase-like n=1 Tax=Halichondria panicea TaxID=6063 RepID=UPI00312B5307